MPTVVPILMGAALLFSTSLVLGNYMYHVYIYRNLLKLIEMNPYAFYLKDKLFSIIFENFPAHYQGKRSRMQEIMKYGFPGLDDIRVFSDFVLSYDRRNRVAHWVFEHLTEPSVSNNFGVNRRFSEFRSDLEIASLFRSHNNDYFRSGFDRGHLAAAANHKGNQTHCNETFFLTNIAPQVGRGFNRDAWNNLEIYVRGLTSVYPDVYVCTGSVYQPEIKADYKMYVEYEVIGNSPVAVPTHFFKIIVCKSKDKRFIMEAYMLPNTFISDDVDLKSFRRPPEQIEKAAGLHFFDKIKRNQFVSINGNEMHQEQT